MCNDIENQDGDHATGHAASNGHNGLATDADVMVRRHVGDGPIAMFSVTWYKHA